ncbi:MAG: Maf family protein [Candidatus Binataceae bacterium]
MSSDNQNRRPGLVLGSSSPRRHQLLRQARIDFVVIESGADETPLPGEPARDFALRMARDKALAVSLKAPDDFVLAADTVVEIDGDILNKPEGAAGARAMLRRLSGRTHTVITAFAIARNGAVIEITPILSRVTFRELADDVIDAYIASGEPFDKAGAYGIQGKGADFILRVEGSYSNVMGLPVDETIAALRRHGAV